MAWKHAFKNPKLTMKTIITILVLAITFISNAQALDTKVYGGVFVYSESINVGSQQTFIDNAVVFTKKNVKVSGEQKLIMSKNAKIYYLGHSDISHPYIIKLDGKVKLHEWITLDKYHGKKILLLDGVEKVYEGYVDDIPSSLKVKKGVYDLQVKGVGYFKNVIIK